MCFGGELCTVFGRVVGLCTEKGVEMGERDGSSMDYLVRQRWFFSLYDRMDLSEVRNRC